MPTFLPERQTSCTSPRIKATSAFYPAPDGIAAFAKEFWRIQVQQGARCSFPLDQPLPLELVKRITAFRKAQILAKTMIDIIKTPPDSPDGVCFLRFSATHHDRADNQIQNQQPDEHNRHRIVPFFSASGPSTSPPPARGRSPSPPPE